MAFKGLFGNKNKAKDELTAMLLPSILGIFICAVCLVGGTFAWFTASQDVSAPAIATAEYTVAVTVTEGDAAIEAQNGAYALVPGVEYTVILRATGSATTGYCAVIIDDLLFMPTVQFPTAQNSDTELTFTLVTDKAATIVIEPKWGSSAWQGAKIENGNAYTYGDVDG